MRLWGAVAVAAALLAGAVEGAAQPKYLHVGVASCTDGNCHGAVNPSPLPGSSVQRNEYTIWSQEKIDPAHIDKHHRAYLVLKGARAERIARNLGIADATTSLRCLNCHADYVGDRHGPLWRLADGVGCEACHGGAERWLGVHLSGKGHRANLEAGLRKTEDPAVRAQICLGCHFGDPADENRFVTHEMMGAGHPRMPFELDTFTLAEPAHFIASDAYTKRKGPVSDARVWAIGATASVMLRMEALSKRLPSGIFPELTLFDCRSCHHGIDNEKDLLWERGAPDGLEPGRPRFYDADAMMLEVIAAQLAPGLAERLRRHVLALQRATTQGQAAAVSEAESVRGLARELEAELARRQFVPDDLAALAEGLLAAGPDGAATGFSGAEQTTMALGAIASDLLREGALEAARVPEMNTALDGLYGKLANAAAYRPKDFVKALALVEQALPKRK